MEFKPGQTFVIMEGRYRGYTVVFDKIHPDCPKLAICHNDRYLQIEVKHLTSAVRVADWRET